MKSIQYHEKKQHGCIGFAVELYHVDNTHPRYEMPCHWHMEYEIIRILSGQFLASVNGTNYSARKGDILFIKSGSLHSAIPKDCVYECLVFNLDFLGKERDLTSPYIEGLQSGHILIQNFFTEEECSPWLPSLIQWLFDTMKQRPSGYELIVKGSLLQLFGILYQKGFYCEDNLQSPSMQSRIHHLKKVFRYIDEHYPSSVTLNDLAREAGMSANHFCRFFKEMTNRSPMDYLNFYRIEKACYLLQHSDMSITSVGYQCGYNDASYFSKIFKRYKQETPKEYLSRHLHF